MTLGFVLLTAIIFVFSHGLKAAAGNPCLEPKAVEERMFFASKLSEAKADARDTEFLTIQNAIEEFLKSHTDWEFSHIHIISSSANTPVTKPSNLNPSEISHVNKLNKTSNKDLAQTRMGFAKFGLIKIKSQNLSLSGVEMSFSAEVLGPEFTYHSDPRKHDQNLKFVVSEFTKDYDQRVLEVYQQKKSDYEKVGITSVEQLHDDSIFKSLYDVKYKPFQGYTIFFRGKAGCKLNIPVVKSKSTSKQ